MAEWLYGRSVVAALQAAHRPLHTVYVSSALPPSSELRSLCQVRGVPVEVTAPSRLEQLCKTDRHQGVVVRAGHRPIPVLHALPEPGRSLMPGPEQLQALDAHSVRAALESWLQDDSEAGEDSTPDAAPASRGRQLVVALYRVHDPQNLGAILRSAFFFGAAQVVLSEPRTGTLSRVTAAVSAASAGAAEHVALSQAFSFAQLLREARASGWHVVGTGMGPQHVPSSALRSHVGNASTILVLGNEHDGLPPQVVAECSSMTSIASRIGAPSPLGHNLDSLNVSVAAGVLMSQLC